MLSKSTSFVVCSVLFIVVAPATVNVLPNVVAPVIICPPYSNTFSGADLFSSIRMPSGVCPMLVLEPEGAGLAAAKILALHDEKIAAAIKKMQKGNQQTLYVADSEIRTESYVPVIDAARCKLLISLSYLHSQYFI